MSIQERVRQALTERNAKKQALASTQEQATRDLDRIAVVSNAVVDVLHELATGNDFSAMFSGRFEEIDLAGKALPAMPMGSSQSIVDAAMRNGEQGRSCIKAISSVPHGDGWGNDYVVTFTKGDDDNVECRLRVVDVEHMGYSPADEHWSVHVSQAIELGSDMTQESDVPEMLRQAMEQVVEANMRAKRTISSPTIGF